MSSAGSPAKAALRGLREGFGVPMCVLAASFLGFGALVRESGMALWQGLFSTASAWALPGQVALVELHAVGAPLLAIVVAVGLSNARLLPMVITLMPYLADQNRPRWQYYVAANWVAVTGWAAALRACPGMVAEERLPYFMGYSMVLWPASLAGTAIGFALAGAVPVAVSLGLVFLNPIYFMLVFAADVSSPPRVAALVLGAILGPLLFLVTPDWSLLLTGVIAGTVAFLALHRRR